jgi:N-acetylmuramoyl-L-alanine amidase
MTVRQLVRGALAALVVTLSLPGMQGGGWPGSPVPAHTHGLSAQVVTAGGGRVSTAPPITLRLPGERSATLEVRTHRGYPAIAASGLEPLGWRSETRGALVLLRHRTGLELSFREGSPWMHWEGDRLQMADAAYGFGDELYLPMQLVTDLLPGMLPRAYRYDAAPRTLWVESAVEGAGQAPFTPAGARARQGPTAGAEGAATASAIPPAIAAPGPPAERPPASRLVVIDAGHGGGEPGAVGPGGTREKAVTLAVALALARELAADPWIEVRLTRDDDVLVPIWDRGERATGWRGDRPGVFVSIHANATPDRPGVRGFETYFLSEARTEHERRVAAAENAPFHRERAAAGAGAAVDDPLLAGILSDLMTHDHQHWSALLAEDIQRGLAAFHPGPNRGVKQGPFAVLTNALMPSVLVELGFITNRAEEALLGTPEFHRESARAMAGAIRAFFDRYPPGGTR